MKLGLVLTAVDFSGLSIVDVLKDGRGHDASHIGFRGRDASRVGIRE
jgi:hypothetical protein